MDVRRWLTITVGLAITVGASAEDLGALVGWRTADGLYRSVWVARQGVSLVVRKLPGPLWVVRGGQFWQVGVLRGTGRSALFAGPSGAAPAVGSRSLGAVTLTYLGPEFVSVESGPDGGLLQRRTYEVRALDGPPVPFEDLWGEEGLKTFREKGRDALSALTGANRERLQDGPTPDSWGLGNESGVWRLFGRVDPVRDGDGARRLDFAVTLPLPKRLVETGAPGPDWRRVVAKFPEALGSVTSPDGTLSLVVGRDELNVVGAGGGAIGRTLRTVSLTGGAIVAAQWFQGGSVRQLSLDSAKVQPTAPE